MYKNCKCIGLTLVELTACITVIGLVAIVIYSGTSLYNRAKLNAVIEDFHHYDYAVKTFYEKYGHYPGDMPKATKIWEGQTSNGDGDSKIGRNSINEPENYLAFQHLSLAHYIKGRYSGTGSRGTKIGVNTPRSPYRNLTTYWFYSDTLWDNYPLSIGLFFSGSGSEGYSDHRVNVLDAYYIDKKIDDFRPYTGDVISFSTKNGECITSDMSFINKTDDLKSAKYRLNNQNHNCSVFYNIERNTLEGIL
jgi:hypothetical protein